MFQVILFVFDHSKHNSHNKEKSSYDTDCNEYDDRIGSTQRRPDLGAPTLVSGIDESVLLVLLVGSRSVESVPVVV